MTKAASKDHSFSRPGWLVLTAVYFLWTAVMLRTLANTMIRPRLPLYLALEILYLVLYSWMLWRPVRSLAWRHLYFVFQSLLVLALLSMRARFDLIVVLFVLLELQSALLFSSRVRWMWVGILSALIVLPLTIALGVLLGLSLALMPMTIGIVFPAYLSVTQEIETGLLNRQALLSELQAKNQQLTASAGQMEEWSAIQERNRLGRQLNDSTSQTIFSIRLRVRAAQILLANITDEQGSQLVEQGSQLVELRSQLVELRAVTQSALEDMRSLIVHLRPPEAESAASPTPED